MRARMKQTRQYWLVVIGTRTFGFYAKTRGHAARQAFRNAIALGYIANQPPSTPEGGWEGVSIELERQR